MSVEPAGGAGDLSCGWGGEQEGRKIVGQRKSGESPWTRIASLFFSGKRLCVEPLEKAVGTSLSCGAQGDCQPPEQKWLSGVQDTDSPKESLERECVSPARKS